MKFKCSLSELKVLSNQLNNLRVSVPETQHCYNMYQKAKEMQEKAAKLLTNSNSSIDEMSDVIKDVISLDVGFEEINKLKSVSLGLTVF